MDKRYFRLGMVVLALGVLLSLGSSSPRNVVAESVMSPGDMDAATDGFTYQGYLEQNSVPAQGYFDFEVSVWNDSVSGYAVGTSQGLTGQHVDNGIFSFIVYPDEALTDMFKGPERYVQVKVRPTGTSTWTTMPRQPVTPVPYAWSLQPGSILMGSETSTMFEIENRNPGSNASGLEVTGSSTAAGAIQAYNNSGGGPAIYGKVNTAGSAIFGANTSTGAGVYGIAGTGTGIMGVTTSVNGYGVAGMQNGMSVDDKPGLTWESGGIFGGEIGVIGLTDEDEGQAVLGRVVISGANNAWAGMFVNPTGNGIYINAGGTKQGMTVANGSKSAVVPTDDGARLLYSEESTEVMFTDYGFGQLAEGEALILIDPIYTQTVNLDAPYHVFVEVYGDADVYVTDRTAESFSVVLREGVDDVEFSYRIVAKRLGFEDQRLERAPHADGILDDPAFMITNPQLAE